MMLPFLHRRRARAFLIRRSTSNSIASVTLASSLAAFWSIPALAQSIDPTPLGATVLSASADGTLCPADSLLIDIIDGQFLLIRGSLESEETTSSCTITIEFAAPPGVSMGLPHIEWFGTASESSVRRRYQFSDGSPAKFFEGRVEGDYTIDDRDSSFFPAACAENQRQRLEITFEAVTSSNDGLFQLTTLNLDTRWRAGVEYRACGATTPLVASGGALDEFCAGPHARPCAGNLACEFGNNRRPEEEGVCIDPTQRLPPQPLLGPCDGLRGISCDTGLVCWHRDQLGIGEGRLGTCLNTTAGPGEPCRTGVPELECSPDLFCFADAGTQSCVSADGSLGSLCGEGLPECGEGLQCFGTNCTRIGAG